MAASEAVIAAEAERPRAADTTEKLADRERSEAQTHLETAHVLEARAPPEARPVEMGERVPVKLDTGPAKQTIFNFMTSKPVVWMVGLPIAFGVAYLIVQLIKTSIVNDMAKSLGISADQASGLLWTVGIVVFIVVLWIFIRHAQKVYAK